jgi:hypothetical protein
MSPITYPSVVLDGTTLIFKLSLASLRRLRDAGIDLNANPEGRSSEENTRFLIATVAACSHIMQPDGKLKHAGLSIEEVEELLDLRSLPAVEAAVTEAMVKALPATTSPVLPAGQS